MAYEFSAADGQLALDGVGAKSDTSGSVVAEFTAATLNVDTTYLTLSQSPAGQGNLGVKVASSVSGGVLTGSTQGIAGRKDFHAGFRVVSSDANDYAECTIDNSSGTELTLKAVDGVGGPEMRLRLASSDGTPDTGHLQLATESGTVLNISRSGSAYTYAFTVNTLTVNTLAGVNGTAPDGGVYTHGVCTTLPTGGGGDVSGPGSSVDGEIALFDGTDGDTLKRATGTGVVKVTSGVFSAGTVAVSDLAASAVVTESEGIASNDNDTTLPTSAAVKDYVDTAVSSSAGTVLPGTVPGRLTLATGTPVNEGTLSGINTLYFTPFRGSKIALYDGSAWAYHTLTERSLDLTTAAGGGAIADGAIYDVFLYDNSGTLTLELSAAWASASVRTDGVVLQDGVFVKSGAATRLWLGTIKAFGSGATADTPVLRYVWNAYNQVRRWLFTSPGYADDNAATSWTFNSTTWVEANAGGGSRVHWVTGWVDNYEAWHGGYVEPPASQYGFLGLGENSTSTSKADAYTPAGVPAQVAATYAAGVAQGYNWLAMLCRGSAAGTYTVYADNGRGGGSHDPVGTYLRASIWG